MPKSSTNNNLVVSRNDLLTRYDVLLDTLGAMFFGIGQAVFTRRTCEPGLYGGRVGVTAQVTYFRIEVVRALLEIATDVSETFRKRVASAPASISVQSLYPGYLATYAAISDLWQTLDALHAAECLRDAAATAGAKVHACKLVGALEDAFHVLLSVEEALQEVSTLLGEPEGNWPLPNRSSTPGSVEL